MHFATTLAVCTVLQDRHCQYTARESTQSSDTFSSASSTVLWRWSWAWAESCQGTVVEPPCVARRRSARGWRTAKVQTTMSTFQPQQPNASVTQNTAGSVCFCVWTCSPACDINTLLNGNSPLFIIFQYNEQTSFWHSLCFLISCEARLVDVSKV